MSSTRDLLNYIFGCASSSRQEPDSLSSYPIHRSSQKQDYGSSFQTSRIRHTALMNAVISYDLHKVQEILSRRVNLDEVDENGKTALMYAILYKNKAGAELLMNAKANVNFRDPVTGCTPIMLASQILEQDIEMVELLINSNAEINAKDKAEKDALAYAKKNQNQTLVDLLEGAPVQTPKLGVF